ncbi:MAG TPA: TetR/AcrR family transcriptional regulator [Vicinamibacterales bacterium]|nr:TetR/AcrR family transcriptional regulator [Vicinamibacterales bacterium]
MPIDSEKANHSEKGAATRSDILAASVVVFGRMGYGGTRLEDIAREAGISRTTLYHYFSSRQEIFIELGRNASRAASRTVATARSIPTRWNRQHIARLIEAHLEFLDENGTLIYTWTQATWDDPALQELGLSVQLHNFEAIGVELARLRGSTDVDPTMEGIAFLGMIERLWYYAHSGGAPLDPEGMRHTLVTMTEQMLGRHTRKR